MEEEKGFVIKDRRGGEEEAPQNTNKEKQANASNTPPEETKQSANGGQQEGPMPEINFVNFIISLSTTAMFHFGMFPDPETNQVRQNLPAAKQVIDIIVMLQEKTKGNLSAEETTIVEESLYGLRMSYIKLTQGTP